MGFLPLLSLTKAAENKYVLIALSCCGGDFFLACTNFGRMFDKSFPTCTFFLKWRLGFAHGFHSSGQDQSTVAQRAEMSVVSII